MHIDLIFAESTMKTNDANKLHRQTQKNIVLCEQNELNKWMNTKDFIIFLSLFRSIAIHVFDFIR